MVLRDAAEPSTRNPQALQGWHKGRQVAAIVTDQGVDYEAQLAEYKAARAFLNSKIAEAEANEDYLLACQYSQQKKALAEPVRRRKWTQETSGTLEPGDLRTEPEDAAAATGSGNIKSTVVISDGTLREDDGEAQAVPPLTAVSTRTIDASVDVPLTRTVDGSLTRSTWTGPAPGTGGQGQGSPLDLLLAPPPKLLGPFAPRNKLVVGEDQNYLAQEQRIARRPRQLLVGQRHLRQLGFGERHAVSRGRDKGDDGRWYLATPPHGVPVVTAYGGIRGERLGEHHRVRALSARLAADSEPAAPAHHRALALPLPDRFDSIPRQVAWRFFNPPST